MPFTWKPSVTVAAIIERDGRFLLIEEETSEGIRLNQPAGHLDENESLEQAVVREVNEEAAHEFIPTGLVGDFVSFSFQANKNITTGEGGALVLNNLEEAKLAEKYRLQGVSRSGVEGIDVDVLGGKYNMSDIMATIGLGQMKTIAAVTAHLKWLPRWTSCLPSTQPPS